MQSGRRRCCFSSAKFVVFIASIYVFASLGESS